MPAPAGAGRFTEPARGLRVAAAPEPAGGGAAAEFFAFAPLDGFSRRQRLLIRIAERAFQGLIAAIGPTLRWELHGSEHIEAIYGSGRLPVYCFFHNRIFGATWFWRRRGIVVMTSKSFDGEYIARFIQRFGYGAARGSSTRGGAGALIGQIRAMRAGYEAAFTVDGPKGPVYEVKPGPAALARKTGNPLLPFTVATDRYWEIRSWDRFRIPKPFCRAVVALGAPIDVARDADDAALERARRELQDTLDDLRRMYD